jgi:hypothetical protein
MPCQDRGQTFPTDTVRTIHGVVSICAEDGEWVPAPDIGDDAPPAAAGGANPK